MTISNSKYENLLGLHIDNQLTYELHIRSLCKKASQKLNAFTKITYSVKFEQKKTSSYAPVAWMFHNQKLNSQIICIHERALKIVYQDHNSTFDELLAKDGSSKFMTVIFRNYLLKHLKLK